MERQNNQWQKPPGFCVASSLLNGSLLLIQILITLFLASVSDHSLGAEPCLYVDPTAISPSSLPVQVAQATCLTALGPSHAPLVDLGLVHLIQYFLTFFPSLTPHEISVDIFFTQILPKFLPWYFNTTDILCIYLYSPLKDNEPSSHVSLFVPLEGRIMAP